jgi:hypothetical protein
MTWLYRINFENIGYGNQDLMNQWCAENCKGQWDSETYFALYWRFTEERDAVMFKLRWSTADGNRLK